MADKKAIHHPDADLNRDRPFVSAIECDGWLYVSGQGPVDFATGKAVVGTIEEETELTLQHIDKILKAAGCTADDVVKCTCHISDYKYFEGFNNAYKKYFTGIRPARTTVQSVLWSNIKVEIDCIARIPRK
jgi:2-iminobutanoate/2-iminopropanoate deaminase